MAVKGRMERDADRAANADGTELVSVDDETIILQHTAGEGVLSDSWDVLEDDYTRVDSEMAEIDGTTVLFSTWEVAQ